MARSILIIEDDPDIADILRYGWERQAFEASHRCRWRGGIIGIVGSKQSTSPDSARFSFARDEWHRNLSTAAAAAINREHSDCDADGEIFTFRLRQCTRSRPDGIHY